MPTKSWTFSDLPAPEIDLDLQYEYSFDPGNLNGLPENCWPASEDCEVLPPDEYKQIIRKAYFDAAELAIKQIEDEIELMQDDCEPREWAEGEDYDC